jgi:hypothetical protein
MSRVTTSQKLVGASALWYRRESSDRQENFTAPLRMARMPSEMENPPTMTEAQKKIGEYNMPSNEEVEGSPESRAASTIVRGRGKAYVHAEVIQSERYLAGVALTVDPSMRTTTVDVQNGFGMWGGFGKNSIS